VEEQDLLEVGTVARAHGLRGEVVVALVTNRLERVAPGAVLFSATGRQLVVRESRPHQGRHIVAFEGVASREAAERLHGDRLYAERVPTDGELYVHELIGAEVVEVSGTARGRVTAVEANPASDLLVVEDRWYVPLRFVLEQRGDQVIVDPPEGLFE
jgi:16S rRNA processing protein RimM